MTEEEPELAAHILSALRVMKREMRAASDERAMYAVACRQLVALADLRFAWVGELDGASHSVVPVASAGDGDGYLASIRVSYAPSALGSGPTGSAARDGRAHFSPDISSDPSMSPWREAALARGFRSSCAVPIVRGGTVVAVLSMYRARLGFGAPLEQSLAESVADEIGFALASLDERRARESVNARLVASEELYRTLFDAATDGIFTTDADLRYSNVNAAGCEMLGYTREELVGRSITDLIDPGDLAGRPADPKRFEPDKPFVLERRLVRKDGRRIDVEIHGVLLPDGRMHSVTRDVSERKRTDAEQAANERVVTLGRVAQGVGHEINNPLSYVMLMLSGLEERLRDGEQPTWDDIAEIVGSALDGTRRVAHIVRSLSSFGRGDVESVGSVDVGRAVTAAENLTRNRLEHVARVEIDRTPVPPVRANEFGLTQVLVNLLLNAADAIESMPLAPAAPRPVVRVLPRPDGHGGAWLEVVDAGPGLDLAVLGRLFEPFVTTKGPGRGTGLGLSISRAILARFGATIEAENVAGGGARFRIHLAAADPTTPARPPSEAPPASRRLRILVVDDEPLVRRSIALLLDEHDVEPVGDVASAIEICGRAPPDVVLCDLMLPGLPGSALHEALSRTNPALAARIVYVTGGAFTQASQDFLANTGNVTLLKPFTLGELHAAIAEALLR